MKSKDELPKCKDCSNFRSGMYCECKLHKKRTGEYESCEKFIKRTS